MLQRIILLLAPLLAALGAHAQPNIVLILSDDAGYNEIGYTGANDFLTPNIDALAGAGVRFTSAYVTQPTCGPSRAGLLSGIYQQRFGFEWNTPHEMNRPEGLPPGQITLAHRLRDLGYTTGAIGKWHLGSLPGVNTPADVGFDHFYGFISGSRQYWAGDPDPWNHLRRGATDIEATWGAEGDPALYDPTRGRYLTDAFGEEAVAFIHDHASDPQPFFLYLAMSAPHSPYQAKSADLAAFPNLTGDKRTRAAMTLAMDRAVGWVLDALEANNIDDDTIVVYYNDNGGTADRDNAPFSGYKGQTLDGGVRVPACIRWPGLPQGAVFEHPVSTLDLTPTLLAAAGAQADDAQGVNLIPYLTGQLQDPPHEWLYFRDRWGWAIRGPRWKLVRPDSSFPTASLYDMLADPGETTDLRAQLPEIVDQLERQFTIWEATIDKYRWTESGSEGLNQFDHFRSRLPTSSFKWSNSNAWFREDTTEIVTLKQRDCYANAVLEFPTRATLYAADNALPRITGLPVMLNQLRFTSDGVDSPNTGRITGQPLVMVPTLDGEDPAVVVSAAATAFSFRVETPIEFLGTLRLAGDGATPLTLAAPLTELVPGQSAAKTGHCEIEILQALQCSGDIDIAQGLLRFRAAGPSTASTLRVHSGATLALHDNARASANTLELAGALRGRGLLRVDADYLTAGPDAELRVTLAGHDAGDGFDQLQVSGLATLGATLSIHVEPLFTPAPGDTFRIVQAAQRAGQFADAVIASGNPNWRPQLIYDDTGVTLRVGCRADLDDSGVTDTRDFLAYLTAWSAADPAADWNNDGTVNTLDFTLFLNDWVACRA